MKFEENTTFKRFKKAYKEDVGKLVIITGAGLSASLGLPNWKELREAVQKACDEQADLKSTQSVYYDIDKYEEIEKTENYWQFFKFAKEFLGDLSYRETIRDCIPSDLSSASDELIKLCSLSPAGLITLNLDDTSQRALQTSFPGEAIQFFSGKEINRNWRALKRQKKWCVHLHGYIDQRDTWILDTDELESIKNTEGHQLFLNTVYLDYTVLFAGISATDVAVSARLLELKEAGFEIRRVFWLTDDKREATARLAENLDIQIIPYIRDTGISHSKAIDSFVKEIKKKSTLADESTPPEAHSNSWLSANITSADPDELATKSPEEARMATNRILSDRLSKVDKSKLYDEFNTFLDEYDFPIRSRAFYHSRKSPDFFGYKLIYPELGKGNFGTVFQALDKEGNTVAVKIMHMNIIDNEGMLGGFRRGAKSMHILNDRSIQGVAKIIEHYEIPPTIVMEIAQGNSLQEIFNEFQKSNFTSKIELLQKVSEIVNKCHKLPEQVLHRDIKPSNIIIENLDYDNWSFSGIKVLDFDMSWHRDSYEKDIAFESRDDLGYLCPEQTDPDLLHLSRSTKVDSYGLGMTAYAIFTGKHPTPNASQNPTWSNSVKAAIKRGYTGKLKSLPLRITRLVVESSAYEQDKRLNFTDLCNRLNVIYNSALELDQIVSADVACEELLALLAEGDEYKWNDRTDSGVYNKNNGLSIRTSLISESLIRLNINYEQPGNVSFKNVKTSLNSSKIKISTTTKELGCKLLSSTVNFNTLNFIIDIDAHLLMRDINLYFESYKDAVKELRSLV